MINDEWRMQMFTTARVDVSESQCWSTLNMKFFSSDSAMFITWKFLNSADWALNRAKKENFEAKNQLWTALIQRKSELIGSDVFHGFWISGEKRQISETELIIAVISRILTQVILCYLSELKLVIPRTLTQVTPATSIFKFIFRMIDFRWIYLLQKIASLEKYNIVNARKSQYLYSTIIKSNDLAKFQNISVWKIA